MSIVFTEGAENEAGKWRGPNCGENPRWMHVYCPQCLVAACLFLGPTVAVIANGVATLIGGWTCAACGHHDDDASITGL